MNIILRLHNLKIEMAEHKELLRTAAIHDFFYTAKHECDVCINIEKKIQTIINKERIES